jgi:hypothetical protein
MVLLRGFPRIYIPWWYKGANWLIIEAARQWATKRKMKILTHLEVIKKVMLFYFCLATSCSYELLEVGRQHLLNYWMNICANYSCEHH